MRKIKLSKLRNGQKFSVPEMPNVVWTKIGFDRVLGYYFVRTEDMKARHHYMGGNNLVYTA